MLRIRILTAVVLLPLLLALLLQGPVWGVAFLIIALISVSVFEMSTMIQPRLDEVLRNYAAVGDDIGEAKSIYVAASRPSHYRHLALFCCFVMNVIFTVSALYDLQAGRGIIVFGLIFSTLAGVFATRRIEAEMARILGFVITLVYAGFPWLVIWDLYIKDPNAQYLILVLLVVWMGDTGGYFGGRFFGKHKLAPLKSPKKTWEGAFSGLLASVAGAWVWHNYNQQNTSVSLVTALSCGFLGGVSGQMGDLVESVIKRFTGVKDSGAILPGHGGLLDRIDGVLFAGPVIWLVLYISNVSAKLD
jgi:phosphatidate cytidylyltransferase